MTRDKTCPICDGPVHPKYRPFCSARCADVDLSRWLNEGYAIPVADDEDADEGQPAGETARLPGHDGAG